MREMGERQRVGDGTSGMRGVSNNEINEMEKTVEMPIDTGVLGNSTTCLWFLPCKRPAAER